LSVGDLAIGRVVRVLSHLPLLRYLAILLVAVCARAHAQDPFAQSDAATAAGVAAPTAVAAPQEQPQQGKPIEGSAEASADITPVWTADSANLEGCQVVARFDNQIVLACEVLWRVNQMLEHHQKTASPEKRVPPEELAEVRMQLMKREVGGMVDRKLLFDEFRRNVPPENLPRVEASLQLAGAVRTIRAAGADEAA
jgi:hypothetical protein